MELIVFIAMVLALAVAAWIWGADSREGLDSPEWERRKEWYGKVA